MPFFTKLWEKHLFIDLFYWGSSPWNDSLRALKFWLVSKSVLCKTVCQYLTHGTTWSNIHHRSTTHHWTIWWYSQSGKIKGCFSQRIKCQVPCYQLVSFILDNKQFLIVFYFFGYISSLITFEKGFLHHWMEVLHLFMIILLP